MIVITKYKHIEMFININLNISKVIKSVEYGNDMIVFYIV